MSERPLPAGGSDMLTPYLQKNMPVLATLVAMIFLPGAMTYFGPSIFSGWTDFEWLMSGWAAAVILMFIADENFVPGKRNLSSGFLHPGHISHRLLTNPRFTGGLLVLVVAPPLITFYGPLAFLSTPDWLWLVVGWVVAAGALLLMYSAIRTEESRPG